jgi:xylulokinase
MTSIERAVVIGVDCSTTACKAIAWDGDGSARSEGRACIELSNPERDAWEQDANAWWTATARAIADCVEGLGKGAEIHALCVTHQRETFVVTDQRGQPLHPALVWMDARCRAQVRSVLERLSFEEIHSISGKPPCVTPSLYKLLYLFERVPELRRQTPRVLDVHGFVVGRLTGRFATSLASADPLGLVDMGARRWSAELMALVGLEPAQLPELVEPGSVIGTITPEAAKACDLRAGLPVIAGAGDGQAAGLGAGIVAPGRSYLNLGTAVVSGVLSHDYRVDRAFRTLYAAQPGSYFLETDLQGGTFILTWLARQWLGSETRGVSAALKELETEACKLPPGSDGLLLVPYWNGVMNPYWDDDASGVTIGWHGGHHPAHLYRAVIEGIALEQRLHTSGVEAAAGPIRELVVMGGGSESDLWCQVLADVLEKPIVRSRSSEATALGAGVLAAVGAGLHADLASAVGAMTGSGQRFEPGKNAEFYGRLFREAYAPLYPALRPVLEALARLRAGVTSGGSGSSS